MNQPRDFDVGVARRLAELEKITERHDSLILNPGLSDGTFTPIFLGSTVAGAFTYTTQSGEYFLIGDRVFYFGRLVISAIPTPPTGNMLIGGLPFTSVANPNAGVDFGRISQFNYTAAAIQLTGRKGGGSLTIVLEEVFDNAVMVAVPAATFVNVACDIIFSGVYQKV